MPSSIPARIVLLASPMRRSDCELSDPHARTGVIAEAWSLLPHRELSHGARVIALGWRRCGLSLTLRTATVPEAQQAPFGRFGDFLLPTAIERSMQFGMRAVVLHLKISAKRLTVVQGPIPCGLSWLS